MDINQSPLSRFKSNKPGITRSASNSKATTDAVKSKETSASSMSSTKQLDLKEGQLFKGQIIDHRYNEVRVQIEPGKQVVTAKISVDVPLAIGQEAQFEVTEESAERLVLRYVPDETAALSNPTIQKALTASGLALTERNKSIVEELLNHTLPIDKQTLQTLIKLSHTNREASPLTLVLMYKNQIPMTSANIKQFEAYQNGTHQLLDDIHTLTKNITELLNQSVSEATTSPLNSNSIENHLTLNQGQDTTADFQSNLAQSQATSQSNITQSQVALQNNTTAAQTLVLSSLSQTVPDADAQLNIVLQINEKLIDILYNNSEEPFNVTVPELNPDTVKGQEELTLISKSVEASKSMVDSSSTAMDAALPESNISSAVTPLLEQAGIVQSNSTELTSLLTPEQRAVLLKYMDALPISDNLRSQIADGTANVKDVLTFLQQNLTQTDPSIALTLLQSPEYSMLLEGAFHQKWTVTPEELAKKDSVAKLFQSLQEDTEKLSALTKAVKGDSEALRLQEPVKNLQENLHFMKDLNEMFTYLQLPLQLKNQDMHSDLYVFTKKKALQDKKDNLSVLLHLDMDNLGPLNIYLQMQQNQIQAKFYLSDFEVEELLAEHIPSLTQALMKKGYSLSSELMSNYEKPDFSKDFIEQSSMDNYVQRYTFDIRT